MSSQNTPGSWLARSLRDSLRAFRLGPAGRRQRPIIWGITDKGTCVGGMTIDRFLDRAGAILQESGRVYRLGNTTVIETADSQEPGLTTLAVGSRVETHTVAVLSNLFAVGVETERGVTESLVPSKLIAALLADEDLARRLPEIRYYSRRPCYDDDFILARSGWNAGSGILVHGPEVVPAPHRPDFASEATAIDRLPPHLRDLLRGFLWRSPADLVNAVAMLLTGLLVNHFVGEPHPVGIVDANQPEIGKTLLVQTIGRVLDDAEPPRIPLVRDEELEKKLGAQLRSSRSSLFLIDNVRARIESMILEMNTLSPLISIRILGQSATIERPNMYL